MTFNLGESDQAAITDLDGLTALCKLLSITEQACSKALCYRVVAARGEVIEKGHNKAEAIYGRDALAKVKKVNYIEF